MKTKKKNGDGDGDDDDDEKEDNGGKEKGNDEDVPYDKQFAQYLDTNRDTTTRQGCIYAWGVLQRFIVLQGFDRESYVP